MKNLAILPLPFLCVLAPLAYLIAYCPDFVFLRVLALAFFVAGVFWLIVLTTQTPRDFIAIRLNELAALEDELDMNIECAERNQVVAGAISIGFLRRVMSDRKKSLWKDTRTNCHWFTGNTWLKCTPNPQGSCDNCPHFQNRFAPHQSRNQPRSQPQNLIWKSRKGCGRI